MTRKPPAAVLRQLRSEFGFGCPVPDCGSPYLTWHHFDPPWREREHHNPDGMIALCREHHDKAEAGAFTKDQLRQFKVEGQWRADEVRGRFDWMRREILAVVGGNFYLETPVIVAYQGKPLIWFKRDPDGYLLLNFQMLTMSEHPRVSLEDNYWSAGGNPDDLVSPPSGRLLEVSYSNGDRLRIEFLELDFAEHFEARYPDAMLIATQIAFPITAVELQQGVGGTEIEFGPREKRWGRGGGMRNCFAARCNVGLELG